MNAFGNLVPSTTTPLLKMMLKGQERAKGRCSFSARSDAMKLRVAPQSSKAISDPMPIYPQNGMALGSGSSTIKCITREMCCPFRVYMSLWTMVMWVLSPVSLSSIMIKCNSWRQWCLGMWGEMFRQVNLAPLQLSALYSFSPPKLNSFLQ